MHGFICDEELAPGMEVRLSPEESHHLARVLRLAAGDSVQLMNGRGKLARAEIREPSPREARLEVVTVDVVAQRSRLTVAFGIPKGPALDFIVRRLTEIGVAGFQPLGTRYSLKAKEWNDRRWPRVVLEVCKQCQEPWFPELLAARELGAWLASRDKQKALVFCDENRRWTETEEKGLQSATGVDLLIGAEGGWSDEERELCRAAGAIPLGLGPNRLRAETAALVATVLVKKKLGEL